jgi:hypothetical protein
VPSVQASVNDHWLRLRRFYDLSLHAYRGDRQAWAREARQVALDDGDNPYFRWFLGAH